MRKLLTLLVGSLLLFAQAVVAQTTVSGKVTDSKDGAPLQGVTVRVKGGGTTTTRTDGSYSISSKQADPTLEFSFIGYIIKSVKASGATTNVSLEVDPKALSEVVVTGVGTATSKKRLGIAVESVTADKLPPVPTASIDQALVGKIPGAQISSVSGNPGDPVNIVLRGINSLSGTQPIFLVDGVQINGIDLNSLDLSNIERVEVVQGAASATIYGAQGANGVIQIFTKKGKRGAPSISFSSSYSSNEFLNIGGVQKSKLHPYQTDASGNVLDVATGLPVEFNPDGTLPKIAYRFGAPDIGFPAASRQAILGPDNVNDQPYNANLKFYDHFKQVFQKGFSLNNALSISGAGDRTDYNLSLSNNITESPILKNGQVNRTNLSANIGIELAKGLKLRSTTQVIYTRNDMTPLLGGPGGTYYGLGNQTSTLAGPYANGVYGFLNTSPFFDLTSKLDNGLRTNYFNAQYLSVNTSNPYYYKDYAKGMDNKVEVVQGFDLNYQPFHWLEIDGKYGVSYRNENAKWTIGNQTQNFSTTDNDSWLSVYAPDASGEIDNFQYNNLYQNLLTSATFRFDFDKDFHLNLPIKSTTMVAYDFRKNDYRELDFNANGLVLNPPINMGTAGAIQTILDYKEPFTTYGYLVDQKFDFGSWAGIAGGFRTDWSSNFGTGLNFTFPHANGYVNLAGMNFWKDAKLDNFLPYLKIRAAYGEAGIQPPFGARYPGIDAGNIGGLTTYSIPPVANNPLIKVERTKETEIGTDFTIGLNNTGSWFSAINGSFTWWKRKSIDVITTISEPLSTGVTATRDNGVSLHSQGIQAQLNLPVYKSRTFNWDFTVNFGKAKSIIDEVDGEVSQFTAAAGSVQLKLIAGQPIGQIFGYKALTSVNQMRADGKTPFIPDGEQGNYEIVNGKVVNKNTKAIYFSDEAGFIGDPNPKFNMSFINGFTFRNYLSFGFQVDWISGSHLYNQTKEWMFRDGISGDFDQKVNINGENKAWTAYHASAYYGLGDAAFGPGNNATKDYFYEDASFVRLRNISLGFDIANFAHLKTFKKLQVVLTGRNIWTATKYTGFDPEINTGPANSSFERGIDHSSLPNIKSYQVTLNVGF